MKHKRWLVGFASASLFALSTSIGLAWAPTSVHPWPMLHGNYNHTGYSSTTGPTTGRLRWRVQLAEGGDSAPSNSVAIGSDGTVYVGTPTRIVALNPKNGRIKWYKNYTTVQGPALSEDGNTLYFAGNSKVIALNVHTHQRRWTFRMDDDTIFGPTLDANGVIYQGSWDGYFYAIKKNGNLKWKYQTEGAVSYPPSIDKAGNIYLGGGDAHAGPDSNIYSFDSDGNLRWTYDTGATRVGTPAISHDQKLFFPVAPSLLVLNRRGTLIEFIGPNLSPPPQVITAADDVAGIIGPAIGPTGTIFVGASNGLITAIDPDTYETVWTYQTGGEGTPSFPVVDSDNIVYFGSMDNLMYALDGDDGSVVWTYEAGDAIAEAAPAIGTNHNFYFSADDGYFYAIHD